MLVVKRKNKYAKSSRVSEAKFRHLLKCFALDLDATQIAQLSGLNRNTVNRYLRLLRERIALWCEEESPFEGQIEVDTRSMSRTLEPGGSGGREGGELKTRSLSLEFSKETGKSIHKWCPTVAGKHSMQSFRGK